MAMKTNETNSAEKVKKPWEKPLLHSLNFNNTYNNPLDNGDDTYGNQAS